MIVLGRRQNGDKRRRVLDVGGSVFHKSEWLETPDDRTLSPTCFLVEQPANSTLVPHFHRQNQFQLFVGGGGTIGAHPLNTVTVHYAGSYTGYGPLVAGPEGIQYFTIRTVLESGMIPVSTGRDQMVRGPKRHATAGPIATLSADALRALGRVEQSELIAPAPDGLAAVVSALPPNASLVTPPAPGSQGQFVFVIAGSLRHQGVELGLWEHLFISSDEPAVTLTAGAQGAQIVAMHSPPREAVYTAAQRAVAAA